MTPDKYQQMALKTWYAPDHELYRHPRHPLIKLAGEAGELLDLYGKEEYKPGFNWWDCKTCGFPQNRHRPGLGHQYIPLVLDELGDWFYYWRIVYFIYGQPLNFRDNYSFWDIDYLLSLMAQNSAVMLTDWLDRQRIDGSRIAVLRACFMPLLTKLDCTIDDLAALNYQKLNSEPTAHGWKS